jgi:hypothetical protein
LVARQKRRSSNFEGILIAIRPQRSLYKVLEFEAANFEKPGHHFKLWVKGRFQGLRQGGFKLWVTTEFTLYSPLP